MEQIIITHKDGTTLPLRSKERVSNISKAAQKTALLSDDCVSVTVNSSVPLDLQIGDTAKIYGRPYKLNQLPEPTIDGNRKYTYELRLEGLQYELIDVHYHLPEDTYGDTLYADLAEHLRVLMWNINRIYPNTWTLGEVPSDTEYKNITNSGKNTLQVLQELCDEYGVEFSISTDGTNNTLDIKKQVGVTLPFTLEFGRGKGLYQLSRRNVNNAGVTTRVYYYGGSDNLGRNYGHTKLCLNGKSRLTSYLEDKEAIELYGVREGEKEFNDIKPQRIGVVTALGKDVNTFCDASMFDINAKGTDGKSTKYLIQGTSAKIKFETGQLAGYEFDLHSYDHDTHTFVINKFTDENGLIFPAEDSAAFQISVGDKYSISDIVMPDEYKREAEARLLEEASKHLPTVCQPQVSYKLALTEGFFIAICGKDADVEILHVGDFVKIKDSRIGVDKEVRITQIDRDILRPHTYDITLSDTVTKSTTVRVLNDIKSINETIATNKLADPTKARRKWMATQELLNMVFDPDGDYYSEKIKPLSIETTMLSVGAKSQQFTLRNVTFHANANGDANALVISSGQLVHYAILDGGIKQFAMTGATYFNLHSDMPYYIYARCSRTENAGTFILNESAKSVDSDANYWLFLVGVLNSVVTDEDGSRPARLVSLTYGSSTTNGRFIRTGRIESNAGSCYFDLDNNEIGGIVKFVSNDGSIKDVAEVDENNAQLSNYIDTVVSPAIEDIQEQMDGQVEQYFYAYTPSDNTEPTASWIREDEEAGGYETRREHKNDLFYNTITGKVYRYVENRGPMMYGKPQNYIYYWEELSNEDIVTALELASQAKDTADGKRRVFVSQPYTPYDVGDLWLRTWNDNGINKKDLFRCIASRVSGVAFSVLDWEEATNYDNTKTTIDGGIVTAGTVQLANGTSLSIVAGITGGEEEAENTEDNKKVRIWAGASKANRFSAPFRVLQDGSFVASKGKITGEINATSGVIGEGEEVMRINGNALTYGDITQWGYNTGDKMMLSPQTLRLQAENPSIGYDKRHPFGRISLGKNADMETNAPYATIAHLIKYDTVTRGYGRFSPAFKLYTETAYGGGVAIRANGAIISEGVNQETGSYYKTDSSMLTIINLSPTSGSVFLIDNKTQGKQGQLPDAGFVREFLGNVDAFVYTIKVVLTRGSSYISITHSSGIKLYNYNGTEITGNYNISPNTQHEFMLVYTPTEQYWKVKNLT